MTGWSYWSAHIAPAPRCHHPALKNRAPLERGVAQITGCRSVIDRGVPRQALAAFHWHVRCRTHKEARDSRRLRARERLMPKYLVQASYIGLGVQGLRQEGGSARRAVIEKACSSVGGKLDAFYYAFGDTDVVTIMDLPDNVTAAGVALLVAASGKVDVKTSVLLTPEEVDAAVKVGGDYRPPGG